jgi:hypothetical protein
MTAHSQILRKLSVVVDFSVVGEPNVAILASHRLVSGGREIEDGQAAVTKHDGRVDEHSRAVRAAMNHFVSHPSHQLFGGCELGFEVDDSRYATHRAPIFAPPKAHHNR